MSQPSEAATTVPIVARSDPSYRRRRYVIVFAVTAFAIAFLVDGFIRYPREQQRFWSATPTAQVRMERPHTDLDIRLQQILGLGLLPFAALLLGRFIYASRGEYRLDADTLYVPGHPPIQIERVTALDLALWDRKGIATVTYELPGCATAKLKLDDFAYERNPTDAIVECLRAQLTGNG